MAQHRRKRSAKSARDGIANALTKRIGGSRLEAETAFYLRLYKVPHEREVCIIEGEQYRWDFVVRDFGIAIECQGLKPDGKSAHQTLTGVVRDAIKNNLAVSAGWRVFYITNIQGKSSPMAVVRQIAKLCKSVV